MHYILASLMSFNEPFSDLPLSFVLAVISGDDELSDAAHADELGDTESEFEALV